MAKKYKKINEGLKNEILILLSKKLTHKKISETLNVSPHNVFLINKGIDKYNRGRTVRVSGVSESLYKDLETISEKCGYPKLSQFMKKELVTIRNRYLNK